MNGRIQYIAFFVFCFAIVFENSPLSSLGGVFTASLGVVFIPLFLFYGIANYRGIRRYELVAIVGAVLFLFYSLVMLMFVGEYDAGFIVDRGMRFFLIHSVPLLVFLIFMRYDYEVLKLGSLVVFLVVALSFILNLAMPDFINSESPIQASPAFSPHRMRGFTLEASTYGFQMILAASMVAIAYPSMKYVSIVFLVLGSLLVGSKGMPLSILFSLFVASVLYNRLPLSAKFLIFTPLLVAVMYFSSDELYSVFQSDIERYNSVATRSAVMLTALLSVKDNILGAGYFGFLPSIYENGQQAISILNSWFPNMLNFSEFSNYLYAGAVEGVSTKTLFFDWLIFGGLLFLYLYIKGGVYVFHKLCLVKSFPLMYLFVFLILSTSTYITVESKYIAIMALVFLLKSADNKIKEKSVANSRDKDQSVFVN